MPYPLLAPEMEPCVWMCAGLVSYKLCDRAFDCEHCAFDAAMRGQMLAGTRNATHLGRRAAGGLFPGDRLFTSGHLWVQAVPHDDGSVWRIGLDAFATALIGCATGVHCREAAPSVRRGDPICEVELGMGALRLSAPVSGRVLRANRILESRPEILITDPFGDGWILELDGLDPAGVLGLRTAALAAERTEHDLRRFRRTLALRLLSEPADASPADPAHALRDLRQILCGAGYVALLGKFIH